MGTDAWPSSFRYISKRLVREIVQQDEAVKRRGPRISTGLQVGPFSVGVGRRDPDFTNDFDLVRRATSAVSANTGNLGQPGPYVLCNLDLTMTHFPIFMGWRRGTSNEIAAFFADIRDSVAGRTFVALFGSVSNFLGYAPTESHKGWSPSALEGLYPILDSVLEPGDPQVSAAFVKDDLAYTNDRTILLRARILAEHIAPRFSAERLSVLVRVHRHIHGADVAIAGFESALVGAPIWIATPEPGELQLPQRRR